MSAHLVRAAGGGGAVDLGEVHHLHSRVGVEAHVAVQRRGLHELRGFSAARVAAHLPLLQPPLALAVAALALVVARRVAAQPRHPPAPAARRGLEEVRFGYPLQQGAPVRGRKVRHIHQVRLAQQWELVHPLYEKRRAGEEELEAGELVFQEPFLLLLSVSWRISSR